MVAQMPLHRISVAGPQAVLVTRAPGRP
jgi:hypothetical protein